MRRKKKKSLKEKKNNRGLTSYDKFNLPLRFSSVLNQGSREARGWLRIGQDMGLY